MNDLVKSYYALPTARERSLFLAERAAAAELGAEERETLDLLSRLLSARFGERPSDGKRFPTAFSRPSWTSA